MRGRLEADRGGNSHGPANPQCAASALTKRATSTYLPPPHPLVVVRRNDRSEALAIYRESIAGQRTDNVLELTHPERKRIHNLKYYTWIEQQGKSVDELNAQWHDESYWTSIQGQAPLIDELITEFNREAGVAG